MNEQRKLGMEETRKRLEKEWKQLLEKLHVNDQLADCLFPLVRKKFSNISIRGFFVYAMFEYIREQAAIEGTPLRLSDHEVLFDTQLPLVFELVISAQYLDNQILDGKGGILDGQAYNKTRLWENTLGGSHLRELVYEYIDTLILPQDSSLQKEVRHSVRQAFKVVDQGQFMEKKFSSFENYFQGFNPLPSVGEPTARLLDNDLIDRIWTLLRQEGLSDTHESFTRFYLRRIFCVNAAPFVLMTELLLTLTGYAGTERDRVLHFAREFGMMAQMTNDITDLLPMVYEQDTIEKTHLDAFSDIRNGNITFPLLFFLDLNPGQTLKDFNSEVHTVEKQMLLFEMLRPVCRNALIPFLKKWADHCKRSNLSKANRFYTILADVTSVVYNKRYFRHFGRPPKKNPGMPNKNHSKDIINPY